MQIVSDRLAGPASKPNRMPVVGALLLVLSACTNAQGYEFVRDAGQAKARCERELTVEAQRDCEAAFQQSFEDYRAERREVLDEDHAN